MFYNILLVAGFFCVSSQSIRNSFATRYLNLTARWCIQIESKPRFEVSLTMVEKLPRLSPIFFVLVSALCAVDDDPRIRKILDKHVEALGGWR
ncbi:MAG: hypothetical protein AAGH40_04520, partial [Verrucomicrobiota bacterium]